MTKSKIKSDTELWLENVVNKRSGSIIFSSFGALWLIVEILNYFNTSSLIVQRLQKSGLAFFIAGITISLIIALPKLKVAIYKLNRRDVVIEIVIGDIFDIPGSMIVGNKFHI